VTANLAAALAKVQMNLPELERDRTVEVTQKSGGTYSYSYATLANLSKVALPLLAKHGLSFSSLPGTGSDGKMCLRYHLLHESGEQLSGEFPISGEGGIQIAQRFLWGALGDLVQPEHSRLLERIEFPVEIHRRRCRACRAVRLLLARESPVACPARRPRMPPTGGGPYVVEVQLGFIRSLDGTHSSFAVALPPSTTTRLLLQSGDSVSVSSITR